MGYVAFFVGALIPTFLLSRLFQFILKKWEAGWQKAAFANAMSLIVSTLIGGMGMADGGVFAAVSAFTQYLLPQSVWLAYDLHKLKKKMPRNEVISDSENIDKSGDTGKPNILIILPVYYLMRGEEPFADMAKDYNDPILDIISVYTALYKVYCYNKLLLLKFGKDIYYSTILDKQREKIAANSLDTSEQFTLLMRMFYELDEMHKDEILADLDLESAVAFALINKEKEFADIKNEEIEGAKWMVQIADIFKTGRITIAEYFENCWKNSGFTEDELAAWLTKA